jgi:hypothetical protein
LSALLQLSSNKKLLLVYKNIGGAFPPSQVMPMLLFVAGI